MYSRMSGFGTRCSGFTAMRIVPWRAERAAKGIGRGKGCIEGGIKGGRYRSVGLGGEPCLSSW